MQNTGARVAESEVTFNAGDLKKMETPVVTEGPGTPSPSPRKWYVTTARYVLGVIFMFGAVDGALFLLFGFYLHGRPHEAFLIALEKATYFWVFLKVTQLVGSLSLLTNYKPALGVAVLLPTSSVMFLFYLFDLPGFIPLGVIIAISMIILCRAYSKSYVHIFDNCP